MSSRKTITNMNAGSAGSATVFEYPVCPGAAPKPAWPDEEDQAEESEHARAGEQRPHRAGDAMKPSDNDEAGLAFASGKVRGIEEGRAIEREAQTAARKSEEERFKRQLAKLMSDFVTERGRFLEQAEQEIVELALAVAARILRREAQMDPLLLMGAVRVALGQLAGTSQVALRVPSEQLNLWVEAMDLLPNPAVRPKVVAEEGMRLGDCVIESKVGTVDLGVRSQLGEIERGFFDRAGATGGVRSADRDEARA